MRVDPLTLRRRQHPVPRIGERGRVSSGSSKIVARLQRSGENERRVSVGETCAPRTREASPLALSGTRQDVDVQLKEGVCESGEESDPLIVVRDGRADHKAKGWAERQREQSTHDGKGLFPKIVSSSLLASGDGLDTLCLRRVRLRVSLRSPVRENRTQGSAKGALGNGRPYLNRQKSKNLSTCSKCSAEWPPLPLQSASSSPHSWRTFSGASIGKAKPCMMDWDASSPRLPFGQKY